MPAQEYTCHIEGTTIDSETKELYLVESGTDVRAQTNIISIPVVEGKFCYNLRKDTIGYYELIPVNQYQNGSWRPANFFSENQRVTITYGTKRDKVVVIGTGKETKMMQQCNAEIDVVFNPIFEILNMKRDSIENILNSEIKDMDNEQKRAYVEEFYSENSTNPHSELYKQVGKESEEAIIKKRTATVKWLDEHPCLYGLADMRLSLASGKARSAPTTPYQISSYKNTYSKMYEGHPYHESIKNSLNAVDLVPGNKYIDFEVCNSDGKTVKLSSLYTGRIIYIDLWASWCGPCRKHAKELIPLYEKYKDKGFQVIAIAREQREENMHKAVKKDGYPWLSLLELNDKNQIWLKNGVSNAGGGGFLIDDEGTILAVYPDAEETEMFLKVRLNSQWNTNLPK